LTVRVRAAARAVPERAAAVSFAVGVGRELLVGDDELGLGLGSVVVGFEECAGAGSLDAALDDVGAAALWSADGTASPSLGIAITAPTARAIQRRR
jgi:hypothetical protein